VKNIMAEAEAEAKVEAKAELELKLGQAPTLRLLLFPLEDFKWK
jgi:hypothetical protein